MMVSTVRGDFSKLSGKVELDEKDISKSVIQASIDVAFINTGVAVSDEVNITIDIELSQKSAGKGPV
jgi:polyisoprenoid-binding protein YceI